MLKTRVIPCLLLKKESLIKTVKFDKFGYIGDPINTVRIFNELEVDELVFLDIFATKDNRPPNFNMLQKIADECFMPLAYGGGLKTLDDVHKILNIGLEKVVINSYAIQNPTFITDVAKSFGSQSIIASIDIKKNFWGKYEVFSVSGKNKTKLNYVEWAQELENLGAGELLITSIDREGTWKGFDIDLIHKITDSVNIPVIANGGAGNINHIGEVVKNGQASAVALGSMVVYQGQDLGVLVNFPDRQLLKNALE